MQIKNFKEWLSEQSTVGTEFVDERQIDAVYDKAKLSVRLVRLYDKATNQTLLKNISTIANLSSGAYGLYSSSENKKVIGSQVVNNLKMKFGSDIMSTNKLNTIPNAVIKKYVPGIDERMIQPSDVIRVNIQKHLATHGDSIEAILEIASTIVHECTHELELQNTGATNEAGPIAAERRFMAWFKSNWNLVRQQIPELASYRSSLGSGSKWLQR